MKESQQRKIRIRIRREVVVTGAIHGCSERENERERELGFWVLGRSV